MVGRVGVEGSSLLKVKELGWGQGDLDLFFESLRFSSVLR